MPRRSGLLGLCLLFVGLWLCLPRGISTLAQAPIGIIAASATSSTPDSLPVTDLLDTTKQGSWKPKALDSGEDEGLFIQFEAPTLLDYIEVKIRNAVLCGEISLEFYLDGRRNRRATKDSPQSDGNDIWYTVGTRKVGQDRVYTLAAQGYSEDYEWSRHGLNTLVNSVFIKIAYAEAKSAPLEIATVRFYRKESKAPLPVEAPLVVNGEATASSTLAPETAYGAHNLFDSRLDFAWATDGKQTDGIGQGITLTLGVPSAVSGLMLWNGYQRSPTHYAANARPAAITVKINEAGGFGLKVADRMGRQVLRFPQVQQGVKTISVTVNSVYPGTNYKDMVISELRLVDAGGKAIILNVPVKAPEAVYEPLRQMLDRSFSPLLMGIGTDDFPYRRLRIRSNGSFVSYYYGQVLEGNWEPTANGVRLFGRKYYTDPRDSEYLQAAKAKTPVSIFQNIVEITPVAKIPYADCKKYFRPILADRGFYKYVAAKDRPKVMDWWAAIEDDPKNIQGQTEEALTRKAYDLAAKRKAFLLASPLFTDLFLPGNELDYYSVYPVDGP